MDYNRLFQRHCSEMMYEKGEMIMGWELVKFEFLFKTQEPQIVSQSTRAFEAEVDKKFEEQLMKDLELYDQESE